PDRADRLVRLLRGLPEGEIPDVILVVLVVRDALTLTRAGEVDAREAAVVRELRDVVVDRTIRCDVGDPAVDEALDDLDHPGDVIRRSRIGVGPENSERVEVLEERPGER